MEIIILKLHPQHTKNMKSFHNREDNRFKITEVVEWYLVKHHI